MSIAAVWLPELVSEVIDKANTDDLATKSLHARLCALELAQRAIHPLGTKALLAKRGLPVAPRGRANPNLSPEVLEAIDCAARSWFDASGELQKYEY